MNRRHFLAAVGAALAFPFVGRSKPRAPDVSFFGDWAELVVERWNGVNLADDSAGGYFVPLSGAFMTPDPVDSNGELIPLLLDSHEPTRPLGHLVEIHPGEFRAEWTKEGLALLAKLGRTATTRI
jgi:hypothetical protein